MTRRSAEELVAEARERIGRVAPSELGDVVDAGGLIIDIRPRHQRAEEGDLPGAIVVERNVLEWRLDPGGAFRLPQLDGYDQPVVVVCSEGYASSLAADTLIELGLSSAADLEGGYQAWRSWIDALSAIG
jgi:rhodanese-related sulfurtransferase